jgi:DNA-binding transcriptional MerR regulator
MRYRVEQLAAECDVSVDTVRYYQSRGLLPQPEREGRVAWYGPPHAERIARIRDLRRKGLTLAAIGRVVRGELGEADADLAAAVARELGSAAEPDRDPDGDLLTLDEFAVKSGVPASLIQAVEREGVRIGRRHADGETRYTATDIELVRTALRLLEFGLPLPQLLGLARQADEAMRVLAESAVDLFDDHVRKPIRDTAGDEGAAAAQMIEAFSELLPAVQALVSNHFRRVLLETAEVRFADGDFEGMVGQSARTEAKTSARTSAAP